MYLPPSNKCIFTQRLVNYITSKLRKTAIASSLSLVANVWLKDFFINMFCHCFVRIDGKLVNLTASIVQKMKLANGTVVMDIQKTFSSQSDETGVVLISLQYESGLFNFFRITVK